jgi:hypothetical protein
MRREGLLREYQGVGIMNADNCGAFLPIVTAKILPSRLPDKELFTDHVTHDLGQRAGQLFRKSLDESSFPINRVPDNIGGETFIKGVYVPGIFPVIRHSPLFGTIDVLEQRDIVIAKKKKESEDKEIHKGSFFKKLLDSKSAEKRQHRWSNSIGMSNFISSEDLEWAEKILAHFQAIVSAEDAKIPKHTVRYAKKR